MALTSIRYRPCRSFNRAFTLVEMLVSMAVLVLLVVMVTQLTNTASTTIGLSDKRLDTDEQARLAFSRMDFDFRGMLNRPDADTFFCKNAAGASSSPAGNDAFYFYSQSPGYLSANTGLTSDVSLAGYRVANHQIADANEVKVFPDYVLERVGRALSYQATSPSTSSYRDLPGYLVYSGTSTLPDRYGTIPGRHKDYIGNGNPWDGNGSSAGTLINVGAIVASGVFRMEFCFQVKDPTKFGGNSFVVPVAPGSTPWTNADFSGPSTTKVSGGIPCITMRQIPSEVAAVIVTIAVVDVKSLVLTTPAILLNAAKALPDGDDPSVAATWISKINNGDLRGANKMPPPAAAQVRVYQRFFPLNTSQP